MMIPVSGRSAASAPVVLSIDGDYSAAAIAAVPRATVSWTMHYKEMVCEGPWLTNVLARAGLPTGEAVRGKLLSTVVVATGRDCYRAVFTVDELDHMIGNASVIIADRCNGAALPDADGPIRIVAASDQRGARSVRQLGQLTVAEFPEIPAPR